MSKCKYYAESPIEQWTPGCCVEDGFAFEAVHSLDINKYCQFCGGKIKLKHYTRHPDLDYD